MATDITKDPASLPPLALAYIGDAIFEVYIRLFLLDERYIKVHDLHDHATNLVSAAAQAGFYRKLEPSMTPQEQAIAKRGRNAKSHRVLKRTRMLDYRLSTGFEALVGYLYLSGQKDRLKELLGFVLEREAFLEDHEF